MNALFVIHRMWLLVTAVRQICNEISWVHTLWWKTLIGVTPIHPSLFNCCLFLFRSPQRKHINFNLLIWPTRMVPTLAPLLAAGGITHTLFSSLYRGFILYFIAIFLHQVILSLSLSVFVQKHPSTHRYQTQQQSCRELTAATWGVHKHSLRWKPYKVTYMSHCRMESKPLTGWYFVVKNRAKLSCELKSKPLW